MCLVHISTHYIARDTTIILCNSAGGNEEQQDRNPFTNEAQSRETNFATRHDPSLHDDDDYDSLESIHENSKFTHTHTCQGSPRHRVSGWLCLRSKRKFFLKNPRSK